MNSISRFSQSLDKILFLKMLALAVMVYFGFTRVVQDFLYRDKFEGIINDSFAGFVPSPEPLEIPLYILGYLIIPFLAIGFYYLWKQVYRPLQFRYIVTVAIFLAVLALIAILWKIGLPDLGFYVDYLKSKGLSKAIVLLFTKRIFALRALVLLSVVVLGIVYLFWKQSWSDKIVFYAKSRQLKNWTPVFLILLALLIFHPNMPYEEHHYNYVLGTVNDVLSGKEFLHETTNQYGILPIYMLQMIFLNSSLSYEDLSFVIFIFYFLFYWGIYFFISKWLGSKLFAYLGTLIVVAVTYFLQISPSLSAYFYPGLTPLRYGLYVPVLLLVYYFSQTHKVVFRELAIVIASLALFWNFDSGAYIYGATALTFGYFIFFETTGSWTEKVKQILFLATRFIVLSLVIFGAINIVSFVSAEKFPSWIYYFDQVSQGVVANPLPLLGFFGIYVVVYLATFLHFVYRKILGQKNDLVLLFLTIFGMLSLVYYIGNSAWNLLYPVAVPLILIILFFCYQYLNKRLGLAVFSSVLFFAIFVLIIKLPVEFANRDYQTIGTYTPATCCEAELVGDAEVLKKTYGFLERVPLVHQRGTKLLIYAQKANAFAIYELAQLHSKSRIDKLAVQIQAEQTPYLFIEKTKNDQIEYLEEKVISDYEKIDSLNTLDVYQRKF